MTHPRQKLPETLADVAAQSDSIEAFGLLLREWNHAITRGDVSNRVAIGAAIEQAPRRLNKRFPAGDIADAYLAAYAEWIADQAGIPRPGWTHRRRNPLEQPWFASEARASLLVLSPASFRQRNLFTLPENVVRLRPGRPRVSHEQKRAKARARDRRYRERQREYIRIGRQAAR